MTKRTLDAIKDAVVEVYNKAKKSDAYYQHFLKMKAQEKPYVVRLVPNYKDPKNSLCRVYTHSWNSLLTGQFLESVCSTTWGELCPICTARFKLYRSGKEADRNLSKLIKRKENWLVNCYVIDDPTTPDTKGTLRVLKHGKTLNSIIQEALTGSDSAEFGMAIFDLSENGCNFKIRAEKTAPTATSEAFVTYAKSRFTSKGPIEGLNQTQIDYIENNTFDLANLYPKKTVPQLMEMLDTHAFGKTNFKESTSFDVEELEAGEPNGQHKPADLEDTPDPLDVLQSTPPTTGGAPKVPSAEIEETPGNDMDEKLKNLLENVG